MVKALSYSTISISIPISIPIVCGAVDCSCDSECGERGFDPHGRD